MLSYQISKTSRGRWVKYRRIEEHGEHPRDRQEQKHGSEETLPHARRHETPTKDGKLVGQPDVIEKDENTQADSWPESKRREIKAGGLDTELVLKT